jgi:hypothetical protein
MSGKISTMARKDDYASIAAKDCLKIQPKEQVLIFADGQKLQFAEDMAGAAKSAGGVPTIFYIPASIRPVEEVTVPQAISLVSADVVIYVLETGGSCGVSLSREVAFRHNLIRLPTQYKGRVCMMPGFTEEMKPALAIDYVALARRCKRLKDLLAEKVMGTVHFAFGDSYGLGRSSSRFHTDVMITKPSIFVEGKCIMDNGEFTLKL